MKYNCIKIQSIDASYILDPDPLFVINENKTLKYHLFSHEHYKKNQLHKIITRFVYKIYIIYIKILYIKKS